MILRKIYFCKEIKKCQNILFEKQLLIDKKEGLIPDDVSIDTVDLMNGHEFELFTADLFRKWDIRLN